VRVRHLTLQSQDQPQALICGTLAAEVLVRADKRGRNPYRDRNDGSAEGNKGRNYRRLLFTVLATTAPVLMTPWSFLRK
jgi:hypothetical protein